MAIKILIVDDEHPVADSIAEILDLEGYIVQCAYSGEEALKKAAEFCPNALLSDVLIPGINGFELALKIKKMLPDCRLLLFSGQAATAMLAQDFIPQFAGLGYRFELLPKPLHPAELLSKIEEILVHAA